MRVLIQETTILDGMHQIRQKHLIHRFKEEE